MTDSGAGRTVDFVVPEMDCSSCAGKVESAASRVEGVESVEPEPTTGVARVTFTDESGSVENVRDAVEGAGYAVESTRDEGDSGVSVPDPAEVWTSPRAMKTWTGAVFLVAGLLLEFALTAWNVELGAAVGRTFHAADVALLAAVVASGLPVVRGGYYSARNLSLDIDLLMGVAIVAATGVGYYEEAATLAVLFSIAELLETYSMDRARDSLRELMELSPDEATVKRAGGEETVPVDALSVGDVMVVRPGEKVSTDGVVVAGESAVDESPITGESVPVEKTEGDEVYAGSVVEGGYLEVEVTSSAGDSTLARIVELVQGAQAEKTEREQFVERFADYYTPAVVTLAVLTAVVPPVAFGAAWGTWFVRGLTLLVIACPCAFVISTPVSVVSGVTSAARNGVLVKGGRHLEATADVTAVAFDKTGTLTTGELTVTDVVPAAGVAERDVLTRAAAVERYSEHPLGDAIVDAADDVPAASDFENLTGRGVTAVVDGERSFVGRPALLEERGAALDDISDTVSDLRADGKTVVVVGTEKRVFGAIAVADEVRADAADTVAALRDRGVEHVVMLTGDNEETARAVAEEAGLDDYRAELLPEEKVDAVSALSAEYDATMMVGDGVNDAPALAAATVGVAMGAAGTDTALETADVALMGDDLSKLPYLRSLAQKTTTVIQQNVWASLLAKAVLAVGVPLGYVGVAVAVVVGDMGMSLGVTANALRLGRR